MQNKKPPRTPPLPPLPPPLAAERTLRVLLRRHGALVREIAAKNRVPAPDLEDVVQVVLIVLWRVLERGDAVVHPDAWLSTVTERVAWVQTNANKRWEENVRTAADPSQIEPEPTTEELCMAMQNVELVHELAQTLRPKHREVFVRYELNGESMSQIALSLTIPLGTGYNRLRQGRIAFKKAWELRERQEGWRRRERKLVLLPFAFFQWDEPGGDELLAEQPEVPVMERQLRRKVVSAASSWLPCAMVVLGAFLLFDSALWPVYEAVEARGIVAAMVAPGAAVTARAAGAPAAPAVAPSIAPPVTLSLAPPSARRRKPRRRLETPRILLDTADRMAAEGLQEAVDGALRAYAAHAPDNPFPATRAALGPIGGRLPGAE